MNDRLTRFFAATGPVTSVVVFRMGLAVWTLCYWIPRLPHAAELYARPFMRRVGPLGKWLGSPLPPSWFVTGLMVVLIAACIGFIFSKRPRRYHLVILGCLVGFHALDQMMVRAYGGLGYIAWWLLLLAPYDAPRSTDGATRLGPNTAQRLLGLNWCGVYLITAISKLRNGTPWTSGEAIWRHFHGWAQGDWLLTHWLDFPLWLCQVGALTTVGLELYIAVAIWFKRTRNSAMIAVVLLHLSMTLTLRVSLLFPLIMIIHLCLFVHEDEWRGLKARWERRRLRT